jgi:hypothetical protein
MNSDFADPIHHGSKQIHLGFLERHALGNCELRAAIVMQHLCIKQSPSNTRSGR